MRTKALHKQRGNTTYSGMPFIKRRVTLSCNGVPIGQCDSVVVSEGILFGKLAAFPAWDRFDSEFRSAAIKRERQPELSIEVFDENGSALSTARVHLFRRPCEEIDVDVVIWLLDRRLPTGAMVER
jgi:hypothetical protein